MRGVFLIRLPLVESHYLVLQGFVLLLGLDHESLIIVLIFNQLLILKFMILNLLVVSLADLVQALSLELEHGPLFLKPLHLDVILVL